jgi:hypothetical protein
MPNGPRYAIHTLREYIVKFKTYHQQLASQRGSGGSAQEMQTLQTYVNEYRNDLDGEVVQCFLRLLEIGTFVRELDEIVEITSDVKGLYQMYGLDRSKVDAMVLGRARAVLVGLENKIEDKLKKIRANLGI